ncbi:hypothetical protein [Deinococcus sp. Arct2-2]|uniref:hypothetical protein n=1 Tax=Deinococcus sp. Arct2-2 TaxID=2568653 RepID=UPI001454DBD7|nr:hypothetical protein [Deinococcus sp. Arct2-2]
MEVDPLHHLPWRLRRAFYADLGSEAGGRRVKGWLAILSAQRVLPLVLSATPWEPQPLQDLDAAVRFLRGWTYPIHDEPGFTPERVSLASYDSGEGGYDFFTDESRADVLRAAVAAGKALLEASSDRDPFGGASNIHQHGESLTFSSVKQADEDIEGDDEMFSVLIAVGDAAGAAAVASACGPETSSCDPERLAAFWTWWLDDALPLAFKLADVDWLHQG